MMVSTRHSAHFTYTITNIHKTEQVLTADIPIPFTGDVLELAQSIIGGENDPMITVMDLQSDMSTSLTDFLAQHNQSHYDQSDDELLSAARCGYLDIDGRIKTQDTMHKEEIQEIDAGELLHQLTEFSEAEQFSQCFHRLVHSDQLSEILAREQQYAQLIGDTKHRMDGELSALAIRQQDDMDLMVEQLDVSTTPDDINRLLTKQYTDLHRVRGQREAELAALKGHQRSAYHQWIGAVADEGVGGDGSCRRPAASVASGASMASTPVTNRSTAMMPMHSPLMEESFTIHLGSQLKHMHNIRILAGDIASLCGPLHTEEDSLSALNMALGLYSCSLTGIVVLTPVGRVLINDTVNQNANMSTDFHFDQIDDQITGIQKRLNRMSCGGITPTTTTPVGDAVPSTSSASNTKLRPGDFFVTRHSNLAQAHVVFHLITDEAFAHSTEINSRHPVILGLRNVMKMACRHDVTLLTIPTLLRHSMSEDMTVPWCTRRAELVFKCAKGFMIESASWGGSQLSTLQLLLPHDISEELFGTLVGMVPHIFRVANPKFLDEVSK